ncbi:MAG: ribonuclease HI [Clostridia bacterium]|nr:ribonuclease HI [Clostridia bacterium]
MKKVILYTDGACSFNPGPGGWGAVLIFNNIKKEMSGGEPNTTNNRMELLAVIKGLSALKEKCEVHIFSDSAYIVNSFEQNWIKNWVKNDWKNSNKKPVLNKDLWEQLIELTAKHKVVWHKVKGHADNELNNRCDELATTEAKKYLGSEAPR